MFCEGAYIFRPGELVTEAMKDTLKSGRDLGHQISFQYLFSLYGVKIGHRKESKWVYICAFLVVLGFPYIFI